MRTALTIAGSDSCGGAGIQADIKTMTVNGVYAMSAVTALTAQNTTGVYDIMEVTPDFLEKQLEAVFTDIRPDAVKIGMVSSENLIKVIADCLKKYQAQKVVLDPVMVSSSGTRLMRGQALKALKRDLFPVVDLVTPNIPETEILWGHSIASREEMEAAARAISDAFGVSVLCKGGHSRDGADDVLCLRADGERDLWKEPEPGNERIIWFGGQRISNPNTHGTGCTLSSAIAANLAKGYDLTQSVSFAREYLTGALKAMLDLGKGSGPLNHSYVITM